METFPCSGCGLCCRSVGRAITQAKELIEKGITDEFVKETAEFPYSFTDAGVCEKLLPDNSCAVYEDRPSICSVERTWKKHHSKNISKENYFVSAMMLCNSMMVEGGVNENFYLNVTPESMEDLSSWLKKQDPK